MRIEYNNKKLQRLCTDYRYAKKQISYAVSERLHSLINYINSAKNLSDVAVIPTYHLHPLKGKRQGQFALDLGRKLGWRLIIVPLDEKGAEWKTKDTSVIYNSTSVILILEVSNHYE